MIMSRIRPHLSPRARRVIRILDLILWSILWVFGTFCLVLGTVLTVTGHSQRGALFYGLALLLFAVGMIGW